MIKFKELRNRYNPDGSALRLHQLRLLEMLVFIDKVCQKHDIKYFLSSGTLLGAVRHQGFIPWDDDVDIEIEKDEYEKLVSILYEELKNTDYIIQTPQNDPLYKQPFVKLRDLRSWVDEGNSQDLKYNGCYIDIFPMQARNPFFARISMILIGFFLYKLDFKFVPTRFRKFQIQLSKRILFRLIFPLFDMFSFNKNKVGHMYGVCFDKQRSKENFYPLTKITFEGQIFNAPHNTKQYLTELYGEDFMSLPSKIETHFTKIRLF